MNKIVLTILSCCFLANGSTIQFSKNQSKVDILGRHAQSVRKTPVAKTTFIKKNKPLLLKVTSSYPYNEEKIHTVSGRFAHENNQTTYILDKNVISSTLYFQKIEEIEKKDPARNNYVGSKPTGDKGSYTINFTMGNNIGANSLKIKHELPPSLLGDAKEAQSISAEIFLTYESVLKKDSVWRRALTTGYQGRNIGIHIGYPEHVAEEIVPNIPINYNHAKSCSNWGCENKISGHNLLEFHQANEVARAVKNVAPKAQIYSTPNYFPEAPNTAQTPIYIGIPYLTNNDVNNYSNAKHDIDNYVYHNRVIEIAPAGEIYTWDNQNLYSQGLNVITVGAIDPSTTNYLIHNNIDRPTISNITSSRIDKPEIANFTNMFSPEDPMVNYVGYGTYTTYPAVYWTHGAAALTAGMVADLLQYKKFYQWHPEVVKALLISASSGKVNNANTFLKGNQRVSNIAGHYYPYFTDLYKYNRSQYWNGNNEDHFINEEIVLYEHHITSGRKYRIAIAWLSSGDYVRDFGIIPQDIDLEVCQDDRCYTSNSAKNPFEVVEFTAQTTGDLKVTIKRYNNEGGRVLLGYNLHEFVK